MKMRDYVDGIQGAGSWDRLHDLIQQKQLLGWDLPPVVVDGKEVFVFPGTNREVTVAQVQDEIRRVLANTGRKIPLSALN